MTNFQGNDYEKKLRLRGITVVFRHGERYFINYIQCIKLKFFRSPVSKVEDDIGCLASRDVDRKAFVAYKELAESDEIKAFLKLDPQLKQYPRVPLV